MGAAPRPGRTLAEVLHQQWRRHHDGQPSGVASSTGQDWRGGDRYRLEAPHMHVHALAWIILAAIILAMIVVDIAGHVRTPRTCSAWSVAYIVIALPLRRRRRGLFGDEVRAEYLGGLRTGEGPEHRQPLRLCHHLVRCVPQNQEVLLAGRRPGPASALLHLWRRLIENFSWVFTSSASGLRGLR